MMKLVGRLSTITSLILFLVTISLFSNTPVKAKLLLVAPTVEFISVPRYGDRYGVLTGRVIGIDPATNRIAIYIKVNNIWWTKPTQANPTVVISGEGSWLGDITTGGTDYNALDIAAFAIPASYSPPYLGGAGVLPNELFTNALAYGQTTRSPNDRLFGLDYGPYRLGQAPGGSLPSSAQIAEDMTLIAQKVNVIRLYGSQAANPTVVAQAQAHGIQVILQAWIGTNVIANQNEINHAITLAKSYSNVIAVFVGSEVLLRHDLYGTDVDEATLKGYIQQVQNALSIPVGYADDNTRWLNHTGLLSAVDWVGLDIYGFWNCMNVTDSIPYVENQWQNIMTDARFAGKRILVAETGWPNASSNSACPQITTGSEAAQAQFVAGVVSLAATDGMDLLLFEATDEPWKCSPSLPAECHLGLLKNDRTPFQAWNELADYMPPNAAPERNYYTTATPTLCWNSVSWATGYIVQVDKTKTFTSTSKQIVTVPAHSLCITTLPLTPDGKYYWRVATMSGSSPGAWSEIDNFVVDVP